MLFKYQGIDQLGLKVKSKIEAVNYDDAKAKLKSQKIIHTVLEEDTSISFSMIELKRVRPIKTLDLANISRDLSIYIKAGISLVQAVTLLNDRYKSNKQLKTLFDSLSTFLDEGKNFYTALEMQKAFILPEFYKQSIKVSENGGLLQTVLFELSVYLKNQDRIKKRMSTAMAYPLIMLLLSFFLVGFMLSFIVPKITDIFTQYDQELPLITSFVIGLGDFFSAYYPIVLTLFCLGVMSFVIAFKRFTGFRWMIDRVLLRVPFLGSLIQMSELSRFAYMNSVLIRSGVPIVQSFNLASNIVKNSVIQKVFQTASAKVVEGERLSKTLENNSIYPIDSSFIQAVNIGEETSELSNILSNLAALYNEISRDKIAFFLVLLEPIFMVFVGAVIGFIIVAMLLPIFSMNFM